MSKKKKENTGFVTHRYSECSEDKIKALCESFADHTDVTIHGSMHIMLGTKSGDKDIHVLICDGGDVRMLRQPSNLLTILNCMTSWMTENQIEDTETGDVQ